MRALPKLKISPTEQAVIDCLAENNIHFRIELVAMDVTHSNDWKFDQWRVLFTSGMDAHGHVLTNGHGVNRPAKAETFDYFTGTGYRRAAKATPIDAMNKRMYGARWKPEQFPCSPSAADVLYSLLLDAEAEKENFHAWCDNYGYAPDSKKATKVYEDCLVSARKLNNIMSRDTRGTLSELLQDY